MSYWASLAAVRGLFDTSWDSSSGSGPQDGMMRPISGVRRHWRREDAFVIIVFFYSVSEMALTLDKASNEEMQHPWVQGREDLEGSRSDW